MKDEVFVRGRALTVVVEFTLVISCLVFASKRLVDLLKLATGFQAVFQNIVANLVLVGSFIVLLILNCWNTRTKPRLLVAAALLLTCCVVSAYGNPSFGFVVDLKNLVFSTLPFILLALVLGFDLRLKYPRLAFYVVMIYISFQAVLGIAQASLGQAIVPVLNTDGNSVVNPIYFSDGGSSTSAALLDFGGRVRAFGLTDSGLTLGLFLLLGIVLASRLRDWPVRAILYVLYTYGIYCTYTRVIWVAFFLYVSTVTVIRIGRSGISAGKWLFWAGLVIQVLVVVSATIVSTVSFFAKYPTLISRFNGLLFYLENLQFDARGLLFGQNFTNFVLVYKEITPYTIDNEFMVLVANIGLVGVGTALYIYRACLCRLAVSPNLYVFFCLSTIVGIVNAGSYFFVTIACVALMSSTVAVDPGHQSKSRAEAAESMRGVYV